MNLRVNFDKDEEKMLEDLKKAFGLKANTELIRLLVKKAHKENCEVSK